MHEIKRREEPTITTPSIEGIVAQWRFWEAAIQWQQFPQEIREDLTGELEESSREVRDSNPVAADARLHAADLLDHFADQRVLGINSIVVEEVKFLLPEIERLQKLVSN